jgi:hypothetical protein
MSKFTDRRAFRKNNPRKMDVIPAQMGDGYGNLAYPGKPGYFFCRVAGQIEVIYNDRVAAQNDLLVDVGRDTIAGSETPGIFKVLSTRTSSPAGAGGQVQVGYAPANRYEWMAPGGGQDPLWVQQRQYMPLRTGQYSGMTIEIYPGIVDVGAGVAKIIPFTLLSLSAYVPVNAGNAALVLITIDTDGTIVATKSSEFILANMTSNDLMLANIPPAPAGSCYRSAAVRVYTGQTAVQESRTNTDIIDLRGSNVDAPISTAQAEADAAVLAEARNLIIARTSGPLKALIRSNFQ